MQTRLNYGGSPSAYGAQPAQPLNFGSSMAAYGSEPGGGGGYSVGVPPLPGVSAPVPTAAFQVPAAPGINYQPAGAMLASPSAGIPQDALTSALGGAMGGDQAGFMGGIKNTFMNEDGSFNLGSMGTLAKGIGALGGMWSAHQQNKVAKDALSFQKEAYGTNLTNQIGSYNMALEDRVRSRYAQEGRSEGSADSYINKHKLGS